MYTKYHNIDKFGLSNNLHIQSPVYFNFTLSIPVVNPAFYSTQTTFYVQTLPTGFIEYGQPPKPPIEESTILQPKIVDVKIFYKALSKVSWKCTASLFIGYFYNDLNKAFTFYGVPLPIVSPNET